MGKLNTFFHEVGPKIYLVLYKPSLSMHEVLSHKKALLQALFLLGFVLWLGIEQVVASPTIDLGQKREEQHNSGSGLREPPATPVAKPTLVSRPPTTSTPRSVSPTPGLTPEGTSAALPTGPGLTPEGTSAALPTGPGSGTSRPTATTSPIGLIPIIGAGALVLVLVGIAGVWFLWHTGKRPYASKLAVPESTSVHEPKKVVLVPTSGAASDIANLTAVSAQLTDKGNERSRNEDSLLTLETVQLGNLGGMFLGLYAVADGMGGISDGDIASQLALQALRTEITNRVFLPCFEDLLVSGLDYQSILAEAIEAANRAVYERAKTSGREMGTTLVAALLIGTHLYLGNVGDSRAYLASADQMLRLTKDHTLVDVEVQKGKLTSDQARQHPDRSVLTRSIGGESKVLADMVASSIAPNHSLLLCTDGLWSSIDESDLYRTVLTAKSPLQACRTLIDKANAAGGKDNISCIVVTLQSLRAG
jgi:PPM family protein phosphatase